MTSRQTQRNGRVAAMVAYVQAHPGCRSLEIERAVGVGHTSGLLSYCVNNGLLHQSGRPRFFGYYTSEAEARAHDEENKRRAAQEIAERKRDESRRASQRRRLAAASVAPVAARAAGASSALAPAVAPPPPRVAIVPEVRRVGGVTITTMRAPPGRFEVVGPFTGQITADWLARRAAG